MHDEDTESISCLFSSRANHIPCPLSPLRFAVHAINFKIDTWIRGDHSDGLYRQYILNSELRGGLYRQSNLHLESMSLGII